MTLPPSSKEIMKMKTRREEQLGSKLRDIRSVFKVLKSKPLVHPARVFVEEVMTGLVKHQEFEYDFEVVCDAKESRMCFIYIKDMALKLRHLGFEVDLEMGEGTQEDEMVIYCNVVVEN